MRLAIIGVGHVGLVTAAALARWGHDVVGVDHDSDRIETIRAGTMPFFEPGLEELVQEGLASGRLTFSDKTSDGVRGAEVVFICVGTPSLPGGGPNLTFVERVGREVVRYADRDIVMVEKSTVPAQTGERLSTLVAREAAQLATKVTVRVASNPEFLREGTAVRDTLRPDRIVYGTTDDVARDALRRVYGTVVEETGCPVVETDVATAELIKHASNAFLATRLSFINTVAAICERVGADVEVVAEGMGHDARIGHDFLRAGLGYGGSCFPKDVDAFVHLADNVGVRFGILEEVREVNLAQRARVLDKLRAELWHLESKVVTLLGAAFKPGTDDLREAPAIHLARTMLEEGAAVRIYDPVAAPGVREAVPEAEVYEDVYAALTGSHAAVVCTEWPEIARLTPDDFTSRLAYPIVVDGRNVFDRAAFTAAGLYYHGMGR